VADFYNTLQGTTGAQMNNATQPLNSTANGGKGGNVDASKAATRNLKALQQQAAEAMQPPAPVQTTPGIQGSIFGNATTEPAIVSSMSDKINTLTNNIATGQSDLAAAQAAYNKVAKQKVPQYVNGGYFFKQVNPAYTTWQNNLKNKQTQVTNLQNQLTKNQNDLQKAISRQKDLNIAGQDAVNWGLVAKAAEENGLRNAMQAYQQGMANAGVRNAIMNAAINTVGNGGGGK
jgi:DNA repair exonuclease SbcCD ATPase subunit